MQLLILMLFVAVLAQAIPLAGNDSNHQDLQRRQCVWDPDSQSWNCNNWPPTLAQQRWALREESGLGRVGPGKTMFFYSNLFDPGVKTPSADQQMEVVSLFSTWVGLPQVDQAMRRSQWLAVPPIHTGSSSNDTSDAHVLVVVARTTWNRGIQHGIRGERLYPRRARVECQKRGVGRRAAITIHQDSLGKRFEGIVQDANLCFPGTGFGTFLRSDIGLIAAGRYCAQLVQNKC